MTSLGLNNEGHPIVPSYVEMSSTQDGASYNTKESKLWTRLATLYRKDIIKRYAELRNNKIFDADNIVKFYKDLIVDKISEDNYYLDAEQKYLDLPNGPNRLAQGTRLATVKKWLEERLIFCDTLFEYTLYTGSTVQFRANKPGAKVTLLIKTYSPQYVTVTFSKGDKVRKFCNKDGFTSFEGTAPAGDQNQEMFISSAPFLMEIGGLSGETQVSSLFFESAKRLRKLDVSGSKVITDLSLSTMTSLQELYCYNCTQLASSIDLSSCDNLRVVDAHNTPISGIAFNPLGGSLTELNLSNTNVAQIVLKKQPFLREIDLTNCKKLVTLDISDCPKLERLILPNTALETFKVSNCAGLKEVNVSEGRNLTIVDIYNCENLEKLDISRNYNIKSIINLTGCQGLKTIVADSCSKLKYVAFNHRAKETLKTINFSGCAALVGITTKNVTNGDLTEADFPGAIMDFEGFTPTSLNLYNCQSITKIKNLNYVAAGSSSMFYNCTALTGFENSKLTLRDSITDAFRNCRSLSVLPTFNLTEVTSASRTFEGCSLLTIQQVASILNGLSAKFTSQYRMFASCIGIKVTGSNFPASLFNKCINLTTLSEMFVGCSNITCEFPENLLAPLSKVTTCYHAFSGCKFTGKLKANTFSCMTKGNTNTALTSIYYMFGSNNFTDYDEGILRTLVNLTDASYFLYGNSKLGYVDASIIDKPNFIKADLFAHNPKLKYVNYFFGSCKELNGSFWDSEQNPILLFRNNPALLEASYFFNGCSKITGEIPERIFFTNGNSDSALMVINSFFGGCSGLTGKIPKLLLSKCLDLTEAAWLFSGCSGLVHEETIDPETQTRKRMPIPIELLKNKPELITIAGMFNGCSGLKGDLQEKMLAECPKITSVDSLFKGCSGLTGQIPIDLLSYCKILSNAASIFNNCHNLSGFIPPLLFEKCTQVLDLSYAFYNCDGLTGGVPVELLAKCTKLQNASHMFQHCENLAERGTQFKYAIPEDLFYNCPDLSDVSSMFYYCHRLKGNTILEADGQERTYGIPPLLFYNNSKLKNAHYMFWECYGIGGEIPEELFANQTGELQNVSFMFSGCSALSKIYKEMFGRIDNITGEITTNVPNILTFEETFRGCSNLTGEVPELWKTHKSAKGTRCFAGVTKVSNEIDGAWK